MATNNHTTTFWHFLENYSIEIPIIQRDYAQGRIGKENLRKNFLNDLKEALDKSKEMKLDFIYGSTENGKLYPLDGQQRLTTLWLLHWYIALKAGKLKDASDRLKNFSYETRVSSRNFCEEMCKPENFENHNCCNNVVEFITNQTWFYSAWKQDPTIQSVLRMLGGSKDKNDIEDGIERVFGCCNCISNKGDKFNYYYDILTGEYCPIVFYYLPKDFGNSDDLYVKMNARGEQLTSFENFKADLIGYIKKQAEKDKNWDELLHSQEGLPIKMDTSWTDIFWKHKSKDYRIDDIYYAFLNRFFLNYCFLEIKDENDKRYMYFTGNSSNNNDNAISYETIDDYESNNVIDLDLFIQLTNILNNYYDSKIDESTDILRYNNKWNPKFFFIPRYDDEEKQELIKNAKGDSVKKIFTLTQKERVAYYAICKYFIQGPVEQNDNKESDYTSLKRWMRFVWNLVSVQTADGGDSIRSVAEMKNAISLINDIQDAHAVYETLNQLNASNYSGTILKEQFAEEIAKAKQILDENGNLRKYEGSLKNRDGFKCETWEDAFKVAEETAFFKGAIRFLFQNEKGEIDLDESTNSWNTTHFDIKWKNARECFDEKERDNYRYLQYFVSCCTNLEQMQNIVYDIKTTTWKNNLLNTELLEITHDFLIHTMPADIKCKITEIGKPKDIQKDLVSTNLLANLRYYDSPVCGCSLREMYGQYALLPSNAKSDQKKYVVANKRNEILSSLIESEKISSNQKISNCNFFYGWDIDFEYHKDGKVVYFQWNTDEEIYLKENGCWKKKENPTEYYFCDVKDVSDVVGLCNRLENLIEQASSGK